jgi:predicted phosphodiesterase
LSAWEDALKKILLLGDVHAPYHHRPSWDLMIRTGKRWKPDVIVQMGDFLDMYPTSTYSKRADRPLLIDGEIETGNKLLDQLDSLGAKEKYMILGNHDARLAKYIEKNAQALTNLVKVEDLLQLKSRGWGVTQFGDYLKLGKLYMTHEDGAVGRNAHMKALDNYQANIAIGHVHRLASIYESNVRGENHVGLSVGWLGDASKCDYMKKVGERFWQTGFATALLRPNGIVHTRLHTIIKGVVELDGILYK